jgi:hypothetical protein
MRLKPLAVILHLFLRACTYLVDFFDKKMGTKVLGLVFLKVSEIAYNLHTWGAAVAQR